MTVPVLSVRNLQVEFLTRRSTLRAIDGISFDIAKGEVLGVVGESGAGKSVTGLAVIGLIDPPGRIAGGEIYLSGTRIDHLPTEEIRRIRGKRIGMIFQDPLTSLNPLYTIGHQIIETIRTHTNLSESAARKRAIDLLAEVGIPGPEKRIDAYPHEFSGGMRQRVVIALAICAEPELIIADEPERLALVHGERHAGDRLDRRRVASPPGELLDEIGHLQHRHRAVGGVGQDVIRHVRHPRRSPRRAGTPTADRRSRRGSARAVARRRSGAWRAGSAG